MRMIDVGRDGEMSDKRTSTINRNFYPFPSRYWGKSTSADSVDMTCSPSALLEKEKTANHHLTAGTHG
jgi:hypothetical protein